MELVFAILADEAAAIGGKLYVHGGVVQRIVVPKVPVVQHFAVAAAFRPTSVEEFGREHELTLTVISPDGEPTFRAGPFSAVAPADVNDDLALMVVAVRIVAIALKSDGRWAIELRIGDTVAATLPLDVVVDPDSSELRSGAIP